MKYGLSNREKRLLIERPRRAAERKLLAIERDIVAELGRQAWSEIKRGRGSGRRKPLEIPAGLQRSYLAALKEMVVALIRSGREIARRNRRAYRRKIKGRLPRVARRIHELESAETPEDAIAAAYAKRAAVYAAWVERKVTLWVNLTSRKRFRRTIKRANSVVQAGIVSGWTRKEMRVALERQFAKYTTYELDRVITTEATRAINIGTYGEEQADPLVIGYIWQINYKGCDVCDALHANGFVPKDEIGGDMIPPAHPNCECTLEPVFYGEAAAVDYLAEHPEKDPMQDAA